MNLKRLKRKYGPRKYPGLPKRWNIWKLTDEQLSRVVEPMRKA